MSIHWLAIRTPFFRHSTTLLPSCSWKNHTISNRLIGCTLQISKVDKSSTELIWLSYTCIDCKCKFCSVTLVSDIKWTLPNFHNKLETEIFKHWPLHRSWFSPTRTDGSRWRRRDTGLASWAVCWQRAHTECGPALRSPHRSTSCAQMTQQSVWWPPAGSCCLRSHPRTGRTPVDAKWHNVLFMEKDCQKIR